MTDQYAEEERWVFSFDLKEESEDEYQRVKTDMNILARTQQPQ